MILEIPFVRKAIEKGDNITIDEILAVENLCRRLDVDIMNGLGKDFNPPYLILCFEGIYIGTAYGSHFKFGDCPSEDLITRNLNLIKELNDGLSQIYKKVECSELWLKK